jgi:hypothetical protein
MEQEDDQEPQRAGWIFVQHFVQYGLSLSLASLAHCLPGKDTAEPAPGRHCVAAAFGEFYCQWTVFVWTYSTASVKALEEHGRLAPDQVKASFPWADPHATFAKHGLVLHWPADADAQPGSVRPSGRGATAAIRQHYMDVLPFLRVTKKTSATGDEEDGGSSARKRRRVTSGESQSESEDSDEDQGAFVDLDSL